MILSYIKNSIILVKRVLCIPMVAKVTSVMRDIEELHSSPLFDGETTKRDTASVIGLGFVCFIMVSSFLFSPFRTAFFTIWS